MIIAMDLSTCLIVVLTSIILIDLLSTCSAQPGGNNDRRNKSTTTQRIVDSSSRSASPKMVDHNRTTIRLAGSQHSPFSDGSTTGKAGLSSSGGSDFPISGGSGVSLSGGYVGRSRSFNGKQKLIIVTVLDEPYIMLKQDGLFLTGNDRFEGYIADILERLSSMLGFDYELRLSRDGKYGEVTPEGQWTGTLGEVLAKEADMAVGPLAVTSQRKEHFEFTEPILSLRSSALLRRSRVGRHEHFHTADQLLLSDYTYGVERNSLAQQSMSTSTDQLHRAMWAKLTSFWPSALIDSIQEGVERTRHERFAFIIDSPKAEYLSCRKPCDLYATEPFLDAFVYAFATRKDATVLRTAISQQLRELGRGSELQTLYLKWWRDSCSSLRSAESAGGISVAGMARPRQQQPTTVLNSSSTSWSGRTGLVRRNGANSRGLYNFGWFFFLLYLVLV